MANKHMKRCLTLLVIREMLIKTAVRCYFTPTRVAKITNTKNNMLVRMWRHWNPHITGGNVGGCTLGKIVC